MKPVMTEICPYVKCRLPFINTKPVYCEDLKLLAASPFSGTGRDKFIFLIDVERLKAARYRMPGREWGGYGFTRAADGRLYIGMFSGKIYSFDLRERVFRQAAHPFQKDGTLIWGGGASSRGKVYMGVYPTSEFCEMDISTGDFNIHRLYTDETVSHYARQFVEMPDGKILIGVTGGRSAVFSFDPRDGKTDKLGEWMPEGRYPAAKYYVSLECFLDEKRFLISIGNRILSFNWREGRFEKDYASGLPSHISKLERTDSGVCGISGEGVMFEISDGRCRKVRDIEPDGNRLVYIRNFGGTEFIGLCDNGLFVRFDTAKRNSRVSFQINNESKYGLQVQFVKKNPRAPMIIGSHFINMQMFRVSVNTGRATPSLNKISPHVGQVTCGTFLNEKFYAFSYTRAVLHEMDCSKPFLYGSNPRVLFEAGSSQNRPIAAVNDGKYVYAATSADYGSLGGAIIVFDPASGKKKVYRNFIRQQNPNALFYDAAAGTLVGTTNIMGDCGTCAPKAEHAFVFVWDTRKRETVFKTAPWQAPSLHACALSDKGVLIGFDDTRYFLFDVAGRTMKTGAWKHGCISSGVFLTPSKFLGASGSAVILFDILTGKVESAGIRGLRIAERLSAGRVLAVKGGLSVNILTVK